MKNKIYLVLSIILIGSSIIVLYNKYNKNEDFKKELEKVTNFHQDTQKKWKGKQLIVPKGLTSTKKNYTLNELLDTKKEGGLQIFAYFDSGCSDCVKELTDWTEYLKQAKEKFDFDIFFIAKADHIANLEYQVISQAKFSQEVFVDRDGQFIEINNLPAIKAYQTILAKNGKIIYLGSPIQGDLFKEDLEKHLVSL